jgi:hypothetical protein
LKASAGRSGQAQGSGVTGVEHDVGWGVAALVAGDLGSLQADHHRCGRQPDLDPAAGQSRRDRVVDVTHPHEPVALDPDLGPQVDVGQRIGQGAQEPSLGSQGVGDPAAHTAMVAAPGHLLGPGVRLRLQVAEVVEAPQRQERGLQVPVGPLDLALGLGLAGLQHDQAHAQLPAQGGHLWMQHGPFAHPVGHDRGVVVDHHGLGDAAKALQAPHDRVQQVRHGLGQAVHHRMRRAVRQGGHPAVRLAGGAIAHRDLGGGLPPVPVGELPRQIGGALVAASRQERRANGGHLLLQDGDPTGVAGAAQLLQNDRGRHLGSASSIAAMACLYASSLEPADTRW